jgi:hypothetical protein
LGDPHHLDTPAWKGIVAGLETFLSISKVTIGKGDMTAFWTDLWLGDHTLQDRFPNLFSHSTCMNANVATALTSDFRGTVVPRLSQATETDLRNLAFELSFVILCDDVPDSCWDRITNKKLSNKSLYSNSSRHLQIDEVAEKVWKSAAPLKCKIFCWLAGKRRLPTNERRF